MLDDATRQALEFDALLHLAGGLAQTALGRRCVESLRPSTDIDQIRQLQRETTEARRWVQQLSPSFAGLDDPVPLLAALKVEGLALDPLQILLAAVYIGRAGELRSGMRPWVDEYPLLWGCLEKVPDLSGWTAQVRKAVDAEGRVLDSASPELRRIRALMAQARAQLNEKLQAYCTRLEILQDSYITERSGRYVLPVRAEKKYAIEGVLHGASSSGATVFLEPLAVVALNNELSFLLERESIEVRRVLAEITRQLRLRRGDFSRLVETLGALDAAAARGRLSQRHRGVEPDVSGDAAGCGIALRQARHPMLIEFLGWDTVVPIDVQLEAQTEVLIISGPNTGGKTAALKSIGLVAAMAQTGFHLPAAEARLPLFRKIRADIGDHQSLQENLSTFSSHVLRLKALLAEAESGTLVLLDELGTGTDPSQGAALALAVLETLRARGARVVVTTHLERLKAFAEEHDFAESAAVEFDTRSLRPTFRLLMGLSGQSNALTVAERLGLQPEVIDLARRSMEAVDLEIERYLQRLREQSEELAEMKRKLRAESERGEADLGRRLQQAEEEVKLRRQELDQRLGHLEREFEQALQQQLRLVGDRMERERRRASQLRKMRELRELFRQRVRTESLGPQESGEKIPPARNQEVLVVSLGQSGRFVGMEGKQAVVEIAGKRLEVSLRDLERVEKPAECAPQLPAHVTFTPSGESPVRPELNLVGQTVDDALPRLDKFLDQAFLKNYTSVRIIHGRGTGRLGKALREFLKDHPLVASAAPAAPDRGGEAVTVVELR
ncbi:MAG: Smr/MutS family protein [Acidobacteria bacterium]|nr:Smr/MutS family protein [Acidobacteriota bacterium]